MKEFVITVVPTNRPTILKFETNQFLIKNNNYEFKNIDEAKISPLAKQLFYLPFVKTVYISSNFIALERYDIVEWDDVKDEIAQQLVEYLNAGEPIVIEEENIKKIPVTVYAEVTPNPFVMKFLANKKLVLTTYEFKNVDEAKDSELAKELFQLPYVKEVFLDENYVSVRKYATADWDVVTMELRELILNFLADGKDVVTSESVLTKTAESQRKHLKNDDLDDISKQIINILEEYVKPAVANDGGNIVFESYDPEIKKVSVILQGACSGCPSSTYTLKNGIESILKNMMGDMVHEVVAVNG